MGHAVLMVTDIEPALAFYRDLLGFRISDFIRTPLTAYFLHTNARGITAWHCSRRRTPACIT